MTQPIQGVVFDKDGTLFDFEASWSQTTRALLLDLADGDAARAARFGARVGFDFCEARFSPGSIVIAGRQDEIAEALTEGEPGLSPGALLERMDAATAMAVQVPAVPLPPLMARLRAMGLRLGVATNDSEAPGRAHLAQAGIATAFDFIAGYDSGYGGKPAPGQCLAFARAVGLEPSRVVMVGDSTHDMEAGRAAGMRCVAVLTGMARREDLAQISDAVLQNVGELPDWIVIQNT